MNWTIFHQHVFPIRHKLYRFALRITAGLVVFALTLPLIAEHMSNALRRMPDDVLRVAQWLGAA